MKSVNPCAKTRKVTEPYEVWVGKLCIAGEKPVDCEWRVLKKYQTPENEAKNPYARWFCAVKSDYTFGSWEYGDTYIKDITPYAKMVKGAPDLKKVMREEVNKQNIF